MYLACRNPRRWDTGSTMGPTARTTRSTTFLQARIRRRPCTTLGAMCLSGRWRPSVRLQMGTKSALVSASLQFLYSIDVGTDCRLCVVADTWSHRYSEHLRRSVVMHDDFIYLCPSVVTAFKSKDAFAELWYTVSTCFTFVAVDATCTHICASPRLRPSSLSPGLP